MEKKLPTNYSLCIICQTKKSEKLCSVTETKKLTEAIKARQDAIALRIQQDYTDDFITLKRPKWHGSCRRWYTLKRSYTLAEEKRKSEQLCPEIIGDSTKKGQCEESEQAVRLPRSTFNYCSQCILCEKPFSKRQKQCIAMTQSRGYSLYEKAKRLNDKAMLVKIQGYPGEPIDVVASDVSYHNRCMNRYMNKRLPISDINPETEARQKAFRNLIGKLEGPLLKDKAVFLLSELRNEYRKLLKVQDSQSASTYRSSLLKVHLQEYFGDKVSFWPDESGSYYLIASSVTIGEALTRIQELRNLNEETNNEKITVHKAAKIMRQEAIAHRMQQCDISPMTSDMNITNEEALEIIPDTMFNFSVGLLTGKDYDFEMGGKVICDNELKRKALVMCQQMMYAICKTPSPLTLGTAFHVYNETRSKNMITLLNHMNDSVSYSTFQRYLTSLCEQIMDIEKSEGIYISPAILGSIFIHCAIDNIDWHLNSLDGSSFHAMTINVYGYDEVSRSQLGYQKDNTSEACGLGTDSDDYECSTHCEGSTKFKSSKLCDGKFGFIPKVTTGRKTPRTLSSTNMTEIEPRYLHLSDRRRARSLEGVDLNLLFPEADTFLPDLCLVWQLCRMSPTKLLEVEIDQCPGWSGFFTSLSPIIPQTKIGYGPMVPSGPTDPAVVHKGLEYIVQLTHKYGMKHAIVTADQAIYDIAYALRNSAKEDDPIYKNMILMLGGFHLAMNFIGAIGKIMRNSGAEDIISKTKICKEGTANKIFGSSGDYYQSFRAHKLLHEAMESLHIEAFENWYIENSANNSHDFGKVSDVLHDISTNFLSTPKTDRDLSSILPNESLKEFKKLVHDFDKASNERPTHLYWCNYIQMIDILLCHTASQRLGLWDDYLAYCGKILPYLVAAGHHNYSSALPLFLHEMHTLSETAPEIHNYFKDGHFTIRTKEGAFNGVPADMALEQTYNKDVKEKASGLTGIQLDAKARTKWIYTKPIVASVSHQVKDMLNINQTTEQQHHAEGSTELVSKIKDIVETEMVNPFTTSSPDLLNISTGQKASKEVLHDLLNARQMGMNAVKECIEQKQTKITNIKLKTFEERKKTQHNRQQKKCEQLSSEVVILKRLLQLKDSGQDIDIEQTIGEHECCNHPPSLFESDGSMRHGNKATWLTSIMSQTKTTFIDKLPFSDKVTATVIDTMYFIQQTRFLEQETFSEFQKRCLIKLLRIVPKNSKYIHVPGDRYDNTSSRKSQERNRRSKNGDKPSKEYEVKAALQTPNFKDFTINAKNKASLQDFLCSSWATSTESQLLLGDITLFLSGGFKDVIDSVAVARDRVTPVPELSSTQEECDTRIILHAVYSIQYLGVECLYIIANDTDVIVMLVYYSQTLLKDTEIWVQKDSNQFIPIHEIAGALGPGHCNLQPFLHAFSGKDDTCFLYGIGKAKFQKASRELDCSILESYGDNDNDEKPNELLYNNARNLLMMAYGGKDEFMSLTSMRAHMFMRNKTRDLRCLPPTEDAFQMHLLRTLIATIEQKQAHVSEPQIPSPELFGWKKEEGQYTPICMTKSSYPEVANNLSTCNCSKSRCSRNCSCKKLKVSCCTACKCQGKPEKCDRVPNLDILSDDE